MPNPKPLTLKQRRFVEYYCGEARGNATEAARLAGYKGNDVTLGRVGFENLKKPQIAEAIEGLSNRESHKRILSLEEIQERLTEIALKKSEETLTHQLKALDQLAKLQGGYLSRHEVKSEHTLDADQLAKLLGVSQ